VEGAQYYTLIKNKSRLRTSTPGQLWINPGAACDGAPLCRSRARNRCDVRSCSYGKSF